MIPLALIGSVKSLPWKLIGSIAGTLAVVGAVWWQVHQYGERREQFGRDAVQAQWDDDRLAWEAVNDHIKAEALAQALATAENNAKVMHDYEAKLAAALASGDEYYRLLRQARSEVRRLASAEADRVPGAAEASPPGEDGRLDAAIAAALAEARANAEQLNALILEIGPQVK